MLRTSVVGMTLHDGHPAHHRLDYVELAAPDLAASRAFYAAAFGWEFADYGPTYAGILGPDGQGEVGGLDAGSEARGGGPLVLLFSDDLVATEAAVVAAGGRIVTPAYDFPGGRRFEFADPAGNHLGVWAQP